MKDLDTGMKGQYADTLSALQVCLYGGEPCSFPSISAHPEIGLSADLVLLLTSLLNRIYPDQLDIEKLEMCQ